MDEIKSIYSKVIDEHRSWLKHFSQQYLNKWEKLLKDQPEAAICEAKARKLLSDHDTNVEPQEDISHGGPDFLCKKEGKKFYVEVTCITKETATKKTKLDSEPQINSDSPAKWYRPPTEQILEEIRNKTPQCKDLNEPCLLAICTLHFGVGSCFRDRIIAESVLTGTPHISWDIGLGSQEVLKEPHQATELKNSGFIRPQKNKPYFIEQARKTISAVLLCNFWGHNAVGILHPNPNWLFDRNLLPNIQFCKLADGWQTGKFITEWI